MELAPGRSIVSNKDASSSRGGSDSGRGSASGRDRALDYRSSGADKEKAAGRDYGRESSRSEWDRDRERKEWGGSKGSDKQQQRRRGTVDSRGGSRHYADSSRQEKGYRYLGHRDRSRSEASQMCCCFFGGSCFLRMVLPCFVCFLFCFFGKF